jgi:2-polyprenyl-3-methyl-5-hydroxy-6-metoxy-1,4-benzoquinol methylase
MMAAVEGVKTGKALDVGMGQGRNALFLAGAGWDVTGFDPSDAGIHIAEAAAKRARLELKTAVARSEDFEYGMDKWDLIVITYEPVPLIEPAFVDKLRSSLRSGGRIVVENFAATLRPDEVLKAFGGFRIVRFEDVDAVADWSRSKTRLVRLIAQKE